VTGWGVNGSIAWLVAGVPRGGSVPHRIDVRDYRPIDQIRHHLKHMLQIID
jgi:hypothetical protein